ncbi:MAG: NAD-dependent epimerase/dehydratase, partial [bacterium]
MRSDHQVLVTGGSGYIGSILCEHLLDKGYKVTAVDNLMYKQSPLFHLCNNPNFEFVFGDARDEKLISSLIKGVDVIIPLAAIVGAPACDLDPWMAKSTNFDAVKLINRLRSKNQLIIYPTTNSGYGTKSGDVYCTEETPLQPISLYGKTKSDAESELLASSNTITLRLATVFGMSPRMRLDLLVNHFVYAAVTDGYIVIFEKDFKRNYIHIRDVADCFIYCIEHSDKMIGRPYNVGLDEANLSKEELALKVKEFVPNFYIHFSEVGSDPDKRNY